MFHNKPLLNFSPDTQCNDDLKAPDFFRRLTDCIPGIKKKENGLAIVIVTHCVLSMPPLLNALHATIGDVVAIIPKSSFRSSDMFVALEKLDEVFCKNIDRSYLEEPNNAIKFLLEKTKKHEKFVIIDIGGYFAPSAATIAKHETLGNKFCGIVEDTENGHRRYELVAKNVNANIVSIARTSTKSHEDYFVGLSIVDATNQILNQFGSSASFMGNNFVIGSGKIGRSIAEHLTRRTVKNIVIYDLKPTRLLDASVFQQVSVTENRDEIYRADIIYCATGNKSLKRDDFAKLKDNVYIISCTSADDEFDLTWLNNHENHRSKKSENHITTYVLNTVKSIHLLNDGNAVNFVSGGVNGRFIYPVLGLLMVTAIQLYYKKLNEVNVSTCALLKPSEQTEDLVSTICLETFESSSNKTLFLFGSKHDIFSGIENEPELSTDITSSIPKLAYEHNAISKTKTISGNTLILPNLIKNGWNLPNKNQSFFSRPEIEKDLDEHIEKKVIVLYGSSGTGKTQIAKNFIHTYLGKYPCIWFNADTSEKLTEEYILLGQHIGLISSSPQADSAIKTVIQWLDLLEKKIIVYDNLEKPDYLFKYLPKNRNGIIITSRGKEYQKCWRSVQINIFTDKEAIEFFRQISSSNSLDSEILELAGTHGCLGGLPLAIAQAGAYVRRNKITAAQYMVRFRNEQSRSILISDENMPIDEEAHHKTLAETCHISMEQINHINSNASMLLVLSSYLSADNIPYSIFLHWLIATSSQKLTPILAEMQLDDITSMLEQDYSMITRNTNYDSKKSFSMHRLLQDVIRSEEMHHKRHEENITTLLKTIVNDVISGYYANNFETNNRLLGLLPHIQTLILGHAKLLKLENPIQTELCLRLGPFLNHQYDYENAKNLLDYAMQVAKLNGQTSDTKPNGIFRNLFNNCLTPVKADWERLFEMKAFLESDITCGCEVDQELGALRYSLILVSEEASILTPIENMIILRKKNSNDIEAFFKLPFETAPRTTTITNLSKNALMALEFPQIMREQKVIDRLDYTKKNIIKEISSLCFGNEYLDNSEKKYFQILQKHDEKEKQPDANIGGINFSRCVYYKNIIALYVLKKDFNKANDYCNKMEDIYVNKIKLQKNDSDFGDMLYWQGVVAFKLQNECCLSKLGGALAIYKNIYGLKSIDCAKTLKYLGNAYFRNQINLEKTFACWSDALEIYEYLFKTYHSDKLKYEAIKLQEKLKTLTLPRLHSDNPKNDQDGDCGHASFGITRLNFFDPEKNQTGNTESTYKAESNVNAPKCTSGK